MTASSCLEDLEIAAIVDGSASPPRLVAAQAHAADCDECRALLAAAVRIHVDELAQQRVTELEAGETRREQAPVLGPPPSAGDQLGRYRIIAEIGRGGMGIVYRATDTGLDRPVAIKLLAARSDPDLLARLGREAKAVAQLSHPNVVEIFDVDVLHHAPYLVMEYVEGVTLSEWSRGQHPWREIVDVFVQAGRGLAAAHAVGLVHRDFKPANTMVDAGGNAKVLDFGLARSGGEAPASSDPSAGVLHDLGATLTTAGVAMGTPRYMAPEQHRGERVDARADIYAFGASLYEALYGKPAFEGRTIGVLFANKKRGLSAEPGSTQVPEAVHDIVRKALAYAREDRWASVDDMLDALRRERSTRRRQAGWLSAVGVGAVAAVAFLSQRDNDPLSVAPPGQATSRPIAEDPELAMQAQSLIQEAWQAGKKREGPRGLGLSYAAVSVAAGSGSPQISARAQLQLGGSLIDVRQFEMAVTELQEGIDLAQALGDDRAMANSAPRLIYALGALERTDDAIAAGRLATAAAERLGDKELQVIILANEATALPNSQVRERARRYEKALEIRQSDPELGQPLAVAHLQHNLAGTLTWTDPERARALFEAALETRTQESGPSAMDTLSTRLSLLALDAPSRACLEEGPVLYEAAPASARRIRAETAYLVATCAEALGEPAEGLLWARRAGEFHQSQPETTGYARVLELEGILLGASGKLDEGEAKLQRAILILESLAQGPTPRIAMARHNLAMFLRRGGRLERAEKYARRALAELQANSAGAYETSVVREGLSGVLLERGKFAEVLELWSEEFEAGADASEGSTPLLFAVAQAHYGRALWELRPDERARALQLVDAGLSVLERQEVKADDTRRLREWHDRRRKDAG